MGKEGVKIEIMDTTLRDGEQTSGVSFVPHEKLMIARLLLEDLKVDRVEVASARVSDGEFEAVKMICDWAARRNLLHKVEVLGFVDGHTSVDWIQRTGCRVINLLCKGSLKHCTQQLKKTPEEHLADIINVVHYADEQDITVNVYLEDWSNGIKDSPEYVFQLMDGLQETSVKRYMLPDTLGILNPLQVIEYMRKMKKRYPNTHLDFHAHNDYDLAVSNVLAAVLSGVKGLHTTINGLGERAGNAPLASVQAILKDHFNAATNIDESRLNDVSRQIALNHTAGLSLPQQMQMSLFSLFALLDKEDRYKIKMQDIIHRRLHALWDNTGFTLVEDPLRAGYYSEIDMLVWAKKFYGDDFVAYLQKTYNPLDVVFRLANETSLVLLNGGGFAGPKWSVRVSLANLNEADYVKIGKSIKRVLDEYAKVWQS